DGPMRQSLEKQITSIGGDKIKYLGYQSEVARYLSAGDVFVLPSSIEGFPLSILEAMAMKLAVIASDVGAVSDVIENGQDGFVVKPGSVDDIKNVILKLQKDRKLLEKIKLAARQKLEKKYSNAVLRTNYMKLYKEALK
ncbi:MAG TPA: glycosyltransferase family 4 protein, partial [Candidatus Saccharimonadales bacterium]|nr:glycosyltransferase family 4 protein [Candidatus Saccharimonadales bacterium]